jgi:DNA (cytosine-5)-methyltransferase 1
LRIGSLCTGYGGLDLAAEAVTGGEIAWVAENDPAASKVLAHRFSGVPNLGDITAADWVAVEPVDVLCAGFPCQDISYAGQGAGIQEGNRSGLWYVIADAIGVLRPRLVLLENVAAVVARRPGLDAVLASLAELGFDAEWLCLRASDIGACHGRNRWFAAAYPRGSRRREVARGAHGNESRDAGWPAIDDHVALGSGPERDAAAGSAAEDADRATGGERRQPAPGQAESGRPRADAGRPGRALAADADVRRREDGAQLDGEEEPAAADWGALGDYLDGRADTDWGIYEAAIRRHEAVFGRPAPAPTEPGRGGKPRLSPRLNEWMMGLPEGWVTDVPGLSRNDMLRILGNGVVPQCAAAAYSLLLPAWQQAATEPAAKLTHHPVITLAGVIDLDHNCIAACCLSHHAEVFTGGIDREWLHSTRRPCAEIPPGVPAVSGPATARAARSPRPEATREPETRPQARPSAELVRVAGELL